MSLMSEEQRQRLKSENEQKINQQEVKTNLVIDRWSIVFVLIVISIIIFIIILKKGSMKMAFLPLTVAPVAVGIISASSAKIRRNEYKGQMYFKGEEDCGFTEKFKNEVDGIMIKRNDYLMIPERIFKAPNGTDVVIDEKGNVSFAGFGSKFIGRLRNAGYLNEAPDDCWK